jgi:hypothetical protein
LRDRRLRIDESVREEMQMSDELRRKSNVKEIRLIEKSAELRTS